MGRPVTGSVRHRGARVQVTFDSVTFTCTEQFGDEDSAQAWRRAAAEALRLGRTPPAADRWRHTAVSAVAQPLTDEQRRRTSCQLVFDSLIKTRYEDRHDGGPEREKTVRSYWDNHIYPFLQQGTRTDQPSIQDLTYEVAHAFVMHLAGRGSALRGADTAAPADLWAVGGQGLTARRAAVHAGVSVAEINRRRRSGVLSGTRGSDDVWRYTHQGLREAKLPEHADPGTGLSKPYAREILAPLKMLLEHARALGAREVPDLQSVLVAAEPNKADRLNASRVPGRVSTLGEVRQVAGQLNVIWQLALWLGRLLGLRLGEILGIHVGDVVDLGDVGFIAVDRQGGRPFLIRDEHGRTVLADYKGPKTPQSVRALPLPMALLHLIRIFISAVHTDPDTGLTEPTARLVPILRSATGGQGAFQAALSTAMTCAGLKDIDLHPHKLRADLITDLHDLTDIPGWVTRRFAGHRPGDDVHARHYHRDHPEMTKLKRLVAGLDAMIESDLGGTLVVPTTAVPSPGRDTLLHSRWPNAVTVLRTAGWMLDPWSDDDPLVDSEVVAEMLELSATAARRLLAGGALGSEQRRDSGRLQRVARLSVVLAEQARRRALHFLPDVAATCGLDYDLAKRILVTLSHGVEVDPATGWYVLSDDAALALQEAAGHDASLRARSLRVNDAAPAIGCGLTQVRVLLRAGELVLDPETDYAGRSYVTRASVQQALEQWQGRGRGTRRRRLPVAPAVPKAGHAPA